MKKIPKMSGIFTLVPRVFSPSSYSEKMRWGRGSGILRDNSCETCRNVPQKTPMSGFTNKNSLTDAF